MTKDRQKSSYSAPKLVRYGNMAKITAGGMGSTSEAGDMSSQKKP